MEKEKEIKELIEQRLNLCEESETPFICANIETPEDLSKMVDLVYSYVVNNKLYVGEAILNVERDYNWNIADNPY